MDIQAAEKEYYMKKVLALIMSLIFVLSATPTYVGAAEITAPECTLSSNYAGNIFPGTSNVALTLTVKNADTSSYKFKIDTTIEDSIGNIVATYSNSATIAGGRFYSKTIRPVITKFGIYTVNIKTSVDGTLLSEFSQEFSCVNPPADNMKKDRVGMTVRMISLGSPDVDKSMQITNNLGVGVIKDGVRWYQYERERGVYGLTATNKERLDKEIAYAQENDVELFVCFHGDNPDLYNTAVKIPRDEEALEALKKAAENFAREYKGKISNFSFTNEPDISKRQDVLSCEDFAVALKYFSEGIKTGNPDAKVLGPNVSQVNVYWLEKVIKAGGKEHLDAVAIHPYQGPGSPESLKWTDMIQSVRDMLKRNDCEHIKVYGTEGNSPSSKAYNTELQQGFNLVRSYAMMEATNCMDAFCPHQLFSLTGSNDNENEYGIIRSWKDEKNPYAAKSAYVQVCNFSAQTVGKEHKKLINDGDVYIHHYSDPDGDDVLMMYAEKGAKAVTLKINTESGILADTYGNGEQLWAIDGKYTFVLNDTPVYFKGNFSSASITSNGIKISDTLCEMPKGSNKTLKISLANLSDYEVSTQSTKTLTTGVSASEDSADININVNEIPEKFQFSAKRQMYGTIENRDYVNVYLKKEDKVYAILPIAVDYLNKSADASIYFRPDTTGSGNKWEGVITVRNNKLNESISGNISFINPSSFSKFQFAVDELQPLRETSFRFDVTDSQAATYLWLVANLTLDDGEVIEFQSSGHPRSYYYASGKWTRTQPLMAIKKNDGFKIDGVLSEGEWDSNFLKEFDESVQNEEVAPDDEQRPDDTEDTDDFTQTVLEDFSGDIYSAWDSEFLYVAAQIRDSIHNQHEVPAQMSKSDCFTVTLLNTTLQSHNTKIALSLSDYDGEAKPVLSTCWSSVEGSPYKGVIPDGAEGALTKITRDDKKGITVYESRIPWTRLLGRKAAKNDNFKLSLGATDYDISGTSNKSYSLTRWVCLTSEGDSPMTLLDTSGEVIKSVSDMREGDRFTFVTNPLSYSGKYGMFINQYQSGKLLETKLSEGKGEGLLLCDYEGKTSSTVTVEGTKVSLSTNVSNRPRLGIDTDENSNTYVYYKTEGFDTEGVTSKPRYHLNFSEDIKEGIVSISFDVGRGELDGGNFVKFDEEGNPVSTTDDFLHFRDNDSSSKDRRGFFYASASNGAMYPGKSGANGADTTLAEPYEKNKIYHVDIVFDRDNKTQTTFINGKKMGDMPYEKAMNATDFQFFISWSVGYFDNLCVKHFAPTGKSEVSYSDITTDKVSTSLVKNADEIRCFVFEKNSLHPLMKKYVLK